MKSCHYLDPINPIPSCMGEQWFIRKPLWKMSLLLGWNFADNYLTTRGFSFYNYQADDLVKHVTNFCERYGIKYTIQFSENRVQKIVNVSKSAKTLAVIDVLYKRFYDTLKA